MMSVEVAMPSPEERILAYFDAHPEASIQVRWVPQEIGMFEGRRIMAVEHIELTGSAEKLASEGRLLRIGSGGSTDVLMRMSDPNRACATS